MNIDSFDIDYEKHYHRYQNEIKIDQSILKLHNKVFHDSHKNETKQLPTWYDALKISVNAYKNVFGSEIITSEGIVKRENKKVVKITKHAINKELINQHINLLLRRRISFDIDENVCAKFNIFIQSREPVYLF